MIFKHIPPLCSLPLLNCFTKQKIVTFKGNGWNKTQVTKGQQEGIFGDRTVLSIS